MTNEIKNSPKSERVKKMSLDTKVLLLLSAALFIFAFSAAAISYTIYLNTSIEQHKKMGKSVADMVANTIEASKVNEYLENGYSAKGYMKTKMDLYQIRKISPDIEYVYVYKIMEDGCHVIFDLDTDEVTGSPPGSIEEFDESFKKYVPALLNGEEIEPIISDDSYGWLLSIYTPVYDLNGVCQCYAAVDLSMNDLRDQSRDYLMELAIIFACVFVIIFSVAFILITKNVITPINKMADFAEKFADKKENNLEKNLKQIHRLDIQTGDEIENLYLAFSKMTEEIVDYTNDIKGKNETISKMQSALIMTLADLVESRDENTGQHIKKTAAYVRIILNELKKEGVYEEKLTPDFVEDVVNSAPLHDIGKIAVPDAILNKPGKLTKEEFEIMKNHTTVGGRILKSIIERVPNSHYLHEATNLATYHHEKWNGQGYPTGIAGNDIPLSARIMAVADVFDALVSKRSYKEGFPFEKALGIIEEERGTHFDPKIVDAFLAAKEEVWKVMNEFNEKEG